MQNLERARSFLKSNWIYAVMLAFILSINLIAYVGQKEARTRQQKEAARQKEQAGREKVSLFNKDEIKKRQEKLKRIAQDEPSLYYFLGMVNLLILFIVFIGIIVDIYLLNRFLRGRPPEIRVHDPPPPGWDLGDVVRVALIFLTFGYLFVSFEGMTADHFPIVKDQNFRMVFNTAVVNLVGICVLLYFVSVKYGQRPSALGLVKSDLLKSVGFSITGYIALVPVLILIMTATFFVIKWLNYKPPVQEIVKVFIKEKNMFILAFSALFAAIFGPIAEEIFFRGFMYRAVKQKFGAFWAISGTSVIFAGLHAHLVGFLPILALGVLLAYLYERTGSLIPSITVHIFHNLAMVVLVLVSRVLSV